jgi:chromosome partitioning protein
MGQIIVSGNLKGGTGKTTIAVNLACALARRGFAAIVLDVDPQGSATEWSRRGPLPVPVESVASIQVTGSSRWLSRASELAQTADVLVLDLPPLIMPALASAMMIADLMLVPVTPSAVDVGPTERVLRTIRITRESRPDGRPKALLVANKVDFRGSYDPATEKAVDSLSERWAPPVRQHTDHVNAFAAGTWTGVYAPTSPATTDILALADAVQAMLGIAPGSGSSTGPARPIDAAPLTA